MTTIGTLKHAENGFTGLIRTLTFTAYVSIEPVLEKRGEKSPDYRVYVQSSGPGEIGAAWKRSRNGQDYLWVRIDDPFLPAPLDCRLTKNRSDDYHSLVWERERSRD